MPDREKVIKGLEDSLTNQGCGYMDGVGELYAVSGEVLQNTIALIKEQEPVKPVQHHVYTTKGWFCGACDGRLNKLGKYCGFCGREVKWE